MIYISFLIKNYLFFLKYSRIKSFGNVQAIYLFCFDDVTSNLDVPRHFGAFYLEH